MSVDRLRAPVAGQVYYPIQWEDDDFALLGDAIDGVLRDEGWRT
jgi:hypothetical protein